MVLINGSSLLKSVLELKHTKNYSNQLNEVRLGNMLSGEYVFKKNQYE